MRLGCGVALARVDPLPLRVTSCTAQLLPLDAYKDQRFLSPCLFHYFFYLLPSFFSFFLLLPCSTIMSHQLGEIEGKGSAFAQVENAGLDVKGGVGDYRSEAIAAEDVRPTQL